MVTSRAPRRSPAAPSSSAVLRPRTLLATRPRVTDPRGMDHGDEAEIRQPALRKVGGQARRERDEAAEEGNAQAGPRRQGRQGEEPRAGNRDRALGGARERREGAAEAVVEEDEQEKVGTREEGRGTRAMALPSSLFPLPSSLFPTPDTPRSSGSLPRNSARSPSPSAPACGSSRGSGRSASRSRGSTRSCRGATRRSSRAGPRLARSRAVPRAGARGSTR